MSSTVGTVLNTGRTMTLNGRPPGSPDAVLVQVSSGPDIHADRADFLAAVAAECGVIVIERAGGEPLAEWEAELLDCTPKELAWHAVLRAVNAWDKTPEIDEAQVEALASVMGEDGEFEGGVSLAFRIARRLVARGVRIEVRP